MVIEVGKFYYSKEFGVLMVISHDVTRDDDFSVRAISYNDPVVRHFTRKGCYGNTPNKNFDLIKEVSKEKHPEYFL